MERRTIHVKGVVQGVGFRPFVYRLAHTWQLAGHVLNELGTVHIEVEGEQQAIEGFLKQLELAPPPQAVIASITTQTIAAQGSSEFVIHPSVSQAQGEIVISPDIATCPACLEELFDPANRRYRYPFLNCTDCGPRLTIVEAAPYDRENTTMASFAMCPQCKAEYDDPADRRFHAQPTACPQCGPQLSAYAASGVLLEGGDPLVHFVSAIRQGEIGALKGLGGYHLVCDARLEETVNQLRHRKHRYEKPLAVMVRDLSAARRLCHLNPQEAAILESPLRPIVLLQRRDRTNDGLADSVAFGNQRLGIMLPYTPLHHLLMQDVGEAPLVMTSGNLTDEPIAHQDAEAIERLGAIADVMLVHNRQIHVRCDDSVVQVTSDIAVPIRRSRGYAPAPIPLPRSCSTRMLAVGGQLKGSFALGQATQAFVSHHLGDLDHLAAQQALVRDIRLYENLLAIAPEWIVHDLHPDYASTNYARTRAQDEGLSLLAVQHHHAHMASCMADNQLSSPVIGVVFDGTGLGPDGTVWGGEFLIGDYGQWQRVARFRPVRMPGGDRAILEPWRMAATYCMDAGCELPHFPNEVTEEQLSIVRRISESGFNSPWTSSAGRLFDAVAAITGVRSHVHYEGQAAIELEWLAADVAWDGTHYSFDIQTTSGVQNDHESSSHNQLPAGWTSTPHVWEVDTRRLIAEVVRDVQHGIPQGLIACRFHHTIGAAIAELCLLIRRTYQLNRVVLSGGVFQNQLLLKAACSQLQAKGFDVFQHRNVPTNDAGLCLGQLTVGSACLLNV